MKNILLLSIFLLLVSCGQVEVETEISAVGASPTETQLLATATLQLSETSTATATTSTPEIHEPDVEELPTEILATLTPEPTATPNIPQMEVVGGNLVLEGERVDLGEVEVVEDGNQVKLRWNGDVVGQVVEKDGKYVVRMNPNPDFVESYEAEKVSSVFEWDVFEVGVVRSEVEVEGEEESVTETVMEFRVANDSGKELVVFGMDLETGILTQYAYQLNQEVYGRQRVEGEVNGLRPNEGPIREKVYSSPNQIWGVVYGEPFKDDEWTMYNRMRFASEHKLFSGWYYIWEGAFDRDVEFFNFANWYQREQDGDPCGFECVSVAEYDNLSNIVTPGMPLAIGFAHIFNMEYAMGKDWGSSVMIGMRPWMRQNDLSCSGDVECAEMVGRYWWDEFGFNADFLEAVVRVEEGRRVDPEELRVFVEAVGK